MKTLTRVLVMGMCLVGIWSSGLAQNQTSSIPVDLKIIEQPLGLLLRATFPFVTNAVVSIQSANDLRLLNTDGAEIEDFEVTNAAVFEKTIVPSGAQRFFTASAAPTQTVDSDLDGDELDRVKVTGLLAMGGTTLTLGVPYPVWVDTVAEAGVGTFMPGQLTFEVINAADGTPISGMNITPSSVVMPRRGFEGYLVVTGKPVHPPELGIKVTFRSDLRGEGEVLLIEPLVKSLPDSVTIPEIWPRPDTVPASNSKPASWQHPLGVNGALIGCSGNFGEWPGHGTPPHIHEGFDLAAPATTKVFAVNYGGVAANAGSTISLRHPGGVYSRYLHVDPAPLKRNAYVEQLQEIAAVGQFPGFKEHLHLELSDKSDENGNAINPVSLIPSLAAETRAPKFTSILLRKSNLGNHFAGNRSLPVDPDLNPTIYVGIGARDIDARHTDSVLALRRLTFSYDNRTPLVFDTENLEIVGNYYKNPDTFGYPRLTPTETKARDKVWYQYWFPWDLKREGKELSGPAKFEVTAMDAALNSTMMKFSLGPEIMNKAEIVSPSSRELTVKLKGFLGPFPVGQPGTASLKHHVNLVLAKLPSNAPSAVFAKNNQTTLNVEVPIDRATGSGSEVIPILLPDLASLPPDATFTLEARSGLCSTVGDSIAIRPISSGERVVTGAILNLVSVSPSALMPEWVMPATVEITVTNPKPEVPGATNFFYCGAAAGFPELAAPYPLARGDYPSHPNFIRTKSDPSGRRSIAIGIYQRSYAENETDATWPHYTIDFVGTRSPGKDSYEGFMLIGVEGPWFQHRAVVDKFTVKIREL